jgi:hypothetical protein
LFILTRCRAHVHRPPSTLPSLVDCCLFTPTIAANIMTVDVSVATVTTIAATAAAAVTDVIINATAINTAAIATVAVIAIVTDNGHPCRWRRHCSHCCRRQRRH